MKLKLAILALFIISLAPIYYLSTKILAETSPTTNCSGNCATKEVGDINAINPDNLIPENELDITKEWWVKVTAKGRTKTQTAIQTIYHGADIMLIADVTGSMSWSMPGNISRIEALKNALNIFLEQSRDEDYIGLGTFAYCGQFDTKTPMIWSYEGFSYDAQENVKFGSLIFPLQEFKNKKSQYKSFVNSLSFRNTGEQITINFCQTPNDAVYRGFLNATTIGAGLTIANSQFTNIFNTSSGAPYKSSSTGTNPGPLARGSIPGGVEIPKYIILLSDGEENVDPRATDEEIDNRGNSKIQTAKNTGANIYTILLGDVNNNSAKSILRNIASKESNFYLAPTNEQLKSIYQSIRETITTTNTIITNKDGLSSIINEKINANNFNIITPLKDDNFRLYKIQNGVKNRVDCRGNIQDNCGVSNASSTGFDINLPKAGSTDKFEIWFKVKATTPGKDVVVNKEINGVVSSKIRYEDGYEETVGNTTVNIISQEPYFITAGGGNLFTFNGISKNLLPPNRKLLETSSGSAKGILNRVNTTLNLGGTSPYSKISDAPILDIRRSENINTTKYQYDSMLNPIKNVYALDDINKILTKQRGIYKIQGSATVTVPINYPSGVRNNWHVVFVEGNLFIKKNINIPEQGSSVGSSGIIFIVKGNIGIATDVSKLDGIYIAEGIIDNSCDSNSFSGDSYPDCPSSEASRNSKLTVEGSMISLNGGFRTERKSPIPQDPSEQFIFRPDLLMMASSSIGNINYLWMEVEPKSISR